MPEEQVPPVVAVVVANDPGPWFEECLDALRAQDYPNLDVLVVDAASHDELTARVAAVLPRAYILRQSEAKGFSAAANEALSAVEGASHLLVCHDDVAPAPDALRFMVGEAYRLNAGIVGPKLVEWDAPDRLLQVGLGVDRFGAVIERVEPGELDQAQHDEVREVFAVPGGCTLVRADLFKALGGFDPEIDLFGEDVDFCWRAQVAGARVVVAPAARVRHLELSSSGARSSFDVAALRRRHELRCVLKNYNWPRRLLVGTDLAAGSVVEAVLALLRGDRARARRVRDAWWWNWRHRKTRRIAHKELSEVRQQPDRVVAHLLSRGGRRQALEAVAQNDEVSPLPLGTIARHTPAVEVLFGNEDDDEPIRPAPRRFGEARLPRTGWALAVLIVVVLFAVRNLLASRLPLVGQLLPFPPPSVLLREFFSGWTDAGWQSTGPAPPGFGLVGLFGAILLGSTAQVEKLLLIGPILIGGIGMYRLIRPLGSSRARLAATIAYLGLPLVWNAIAAGNLQGLVSFAGMPFVVSRLCRATRLAPFNAPQQPTGWRGFLGEVAPFGLLLAVMAALAPPTVIAVAAVALSIMLGSIVAGHPRATLRALGVSAGALVVAFVCCLPWSLTFVQSGARWSILAGAVGSPGTAGGVLRLFRFAHGPIGAGWVGWGIPLGASFVLFVAREARLAWATRWWVAALGTVAIAYAGAVGWLGAGGGATLVLLAPAACCLAGAVGLGVSAFEVDLARSRFGWRQNVSVAAGLCLIVGLFPTLVSSVDGRSSLPSSGFDQILGWTGSGNAAKTYDVLWLGDPASVPAPSWQVRRGLAYAVSVDGLPDGRRLWPSANPGLGAQVQQAVTRAVAGLTVRLGSELALSDIRYVVMPDGLAPSLPGVQAPPLVPPPASLVEALQAQSDLRQLPTEGGVIAFTNVAWTSTSPTGGFGSPGGLAPAWPRQLGLVAGLLTVVLVILEGLFRRRRRRFVKIATPPPHVSATSATSSPTDGSGSGPAPGPDVASSDAFDESEAEPVIESAPSTLR